MINITLMSIFAIVTIAACAMTLAMWLSGIKTRKAIESLDRLMARQEGVNDMFDEKLATWEKRYCKLGMSMELKKLAQIDLKKRCDGVTVRLDGLTKRCARIEEALKDEQKRGNLLSDVVLDLGKKATCGTNEKGDE